MEIFELEIERFLGTQTIEQHQGDEGEIPKGTKALPKGGDFLGRERHDDTLGFFEPEAGGDEAMGATVAERGVREIGTLEVVRPGG